MAEDEAEEAQNTEEGEEGAEIGEGGEAGEGQASGSGKKKLIIIVIAALVVIGGAVGGLFATGIIGGSGEHKEEEKAANDTPSGFYEMPEILVNLNTKNRRKNFMKVKLTIEIEGESHLTDIERLKPKIIDTFQVYLREVRPEDMKGSTGLFRLREELLRRVAIIAHPVVVRDILFQDVVIQ